MKVLVPALAIVLAVTACTPTEPVRLGPDGKPLPQVYRISQADRARIQYRMLDAVNAVREARGVRPLELDSRLNAAAATHARDMAVQNRPWTFGSDGSSTLDRVSRAGYQGSVGAELIAETYETELEILAAWLEDPEKRETLLMPRLTDMGFAYYQEPNGKIWWSLITGSRADQVASAF